MSKEKSKKIRLSIPLSQEIYNKIESDSEIVGVSMATYAAMIIGNHYKTQQISLDYAKDNMVEALRGVFEEFAKSKGFDYDTEAKKAFEESVKETKEDIPKIVKEFNEK